MGDRFEGYPSNPGMHRHPRSSYGNYPPSGGPQLFEDTSYPPPPQHQSFPQPPGGDWGSPPPPYGTANFPGQQFFTDPMAQMAMNQLAGQGKQFVNQKIEKYVSFNKLKYYFAVDTSYVAKKLGLIFFPFLHSDWAVKFDQDEPIPPRYDVNAPDLYIPVMAFVTLVLTSGYLLGTQNRFSPEQLGYMSSTVLLWLCVEVAAVSLALYILNISSSALRLFDLVAFSCYKLVCVIAALLASIPLSSLGYFSILAYTSLSLGYFLLKSLRVLILPAASTSDPYTGTGNRRCLYLLLAFCLFQPFLMYWLSAHLIYVPPPPALPLS